MKDRIKRIFQLLHIGTAISRIRGFTIVELMVVVFIISIIFTALFYTLNAGQISNRLGLERMYLDLEVRRTMDWITRDVRQTTAYNIKNNNPTANYIKFNQVIGANTSFTNSPLIFSSDYIEYNYSDTGMVRNLINSEGEIVQSWFFNLTLTQPPFYTYNSTTGEIISLDGDELQKCGKLVINLTAQRTIRNSTLNSNLTQEVAIRNNE